METMYFFWGPVELFQSIDSFLSADRKLVWLSPFGFPPSCWASLEWNLEFRHRKRHTERARFSCGVHGYGRHPDRVAQRISDALDGTEWTWMFDFFLLVLAGWTGGSRKDWMDRDGRLDGGILLAGRDSRGPPKLTGFFPFSSLADAFFHIKMPIISTTLGAFRPPTP